MTSKIVQLHLRHPRTDLLCELLELAILRDVREVAVPAKRTKHELPFVGNLLELLDTAAQDLHELRWAHLEGGLATFLDGELLELPCEDQLAPLDDLLQRKCDVRVRDLHDGRHARTYPACHDLLEERRQLRAR
eukprot:1364005-Heterocapsa_arctica.AAC.1